MLPLVVLVGIVWTASTYGAPIARWSEQARRALAVPPLTVGVALALILPVLPAFLFNQSRIVLLACVLGAVYLLAQGAPFSLSAPAFKLLAPILIGESVALIYVRERGFFNRYGALRASLLAAPLAALVLLDLRLPALLDAGIRHTGWLLDPVSGTRTPWGTVILAVPCLVAVTRLRGTEYPVLAPAFATAILAALIGLDAPSPLWPPGTQAAVVRPLAFGAAGLSLLWCMYLLSWGRAYQDSLTGLPGRRALEERLQQLTGAYCLAMMDIDRFKRFNDRFGHDAGDDVLRLVASILNRHAPGRAYRYGGEEFTIVCQGKDAPSVAKELDRLRTRIASAGLTLRKKAKGRQKRGRVSVTASFGLAERGPKCPTPQGVIKAADKALYRAKRAGRNRVQVG